MASSRKIEERAILALENIIVRHPTMQGHINKCDKELCWDGYISILSYPVEWSHFYKESETRYHSIV